MVVHIPSMREVAKKLVGDFWIKKLIYKFIFTKKTPS
jgi:hypothetical protein